MTERDYAFPHEYKIAEANGISARIVDNRLDSGWTLHDALHKPLRTSPFRQVWAEWKEIAEVNGISHAQMYQRMKKQKMSEEEAATKPLHIRTSNFTNTELAIIKANGLDVNLVSTRIKMLGWSRYRAIHEPKVSEAERVKRAAEGMKRMQERKRQEKEGEDQHDG